MSVPAAPGLSRTDALAAWDGPVTQVRFVDDAKAAAFARLGITTVGDLLRHYPFRYLDLSATTTLARLVTDTDVTVVGTVHDVKVKHPRPRLTIVEVGIVDGTGALLGVWFNQPYMAQRFRAGERVAFAGRVQLDYGLKQIRTPFFEKLGEDGDPSALARVIPIHRATEGLSTNWMRRLISEALAAFGDVPDHLPADLRLARGLVPWSEALRQIHFPDSAESVAAARTRIAYDELFALQIGMAMRRHALVDERPGFAHTTDGPRHAALLAALPFALTDDQRTAVREILADMASAKPMNRMLLGDVGTGKTAVAAVALAAVADSGSQATMMAPTEVLARQYSRAAGPLLDAAEVPWALLTGSTAAAERRRILAGAA
ncbi:MAG: ATP-dependent DNA helicase RecG, partial [Coriobacteriaceae bacterium]|nr:ATP-dependent DNA helicase RecG [Coriobacteriaceae bacterium]